MISKQRDANFGNSWACGESWKPILFVTFREGLHETSVLDIWVAPKGDGGMCNSKIFLYRRCRFVKSSCSIHSRPIATDMSLWGIEPVIIFKSRATSKIAADFSLHSPLAGHSWAEVKSRQYLPRRHSCLQNCSIGELLVVFRILRIHFAYADLPRLNRLVHLGWLLTAPVLWPVAPADDSFKMWATWCYLPPVAPGKYIAAIF